MRNKQAIIQLIMRGCEVMQADGDADVEITKAAVTKSSFKSGARCSSVVRAFAHGAMGHRINPSRGGPIELFLVPVSAPRLV